MSTSAPMKKWPRRLDPEGERTVTSNALLASSEQEAPTPPNDLRMTWLIACRATVEAFHDQMTLLVNAVFVLVIPLLLVAGQLGPAAPRTHDPHARAAFAVTLAVYVLVFFLCSSSDRILLSFQSLGHVVCRLLL